MLALTCSLLGRSSPRIWRWCRPCSSGRSSWRPLCNRAAQRMPSRTVSVCPPTHRSPIPPQASRDADRLAFVASYFGLVCGTWYRAVCITLSRGVALLCDSCPERACFADEFKKGLKKVAVVEYKKKRYANRCVPQIKGPQLAQQETPRRHVRCKARSSSTGEDTFLS